MAFCFFRRIGFCSLIRMCSLLMSSLKSLVSWHSAFSGALVFVFRRPLAPKDRMGTQSVYFGFSPSIFFFWRLSIVLYQGTIEIIFLISIVFLFYIKIQISNQKPKKKNMHFIFISFFFLVWHLKIACSFSADFSIFTMRREGSRKSGDSTIVTYTYKLFFL